MLVTKQQSAIKDTVMMKLYVPNVAYFSAIHTKGNSFEGIV